MKGDFSKDTFRKKKHFRNVPMQQGRVLLDSDWNEQAAINEHRVETGTLDIVGKSGAPYHYPGFEIISVDNAGNPASPGTNLKISEGRFYVDGIMCENDEAVLFADQTDYDKAPLPNVAGRYIFYLDVWQRHITALEDGALREVALGGPDTTTRNKTIWQVKSEKITAASTCADDIPLSVTTAPTGKLMARSELPSGANDPCGLAVSGGYRRLENQLYRVEIHKSAGTRAATTFKWSRDNGSVVVRWESIEASNANNLVVSSTGRDELLGFKSGDWIELIDDKTDLLGLPGPLVQLSKVDSNVLTINPATIIPAGATVTLSTKNPRIRRWDSAGELKPNLNNTDWVELEDGVQVQFKEGSFKSGDYWLIPARTVTANIEWPFADAQSPRGIQHHYAKLAIADLSAGTAAPGWQSISDCRPIFPPLTELVSLYYVGGDGQEAMPGKPLPASLKVGVANGQWAVAGAKVKFEIVAPGVGTLNPVSGLVTTNTSGIAECGLTLGAVPPNVNFSMQVKASLLDAAGNIAPSHLPVIFNASFSMADNVSYKSNCNNWTGSTPPDTVAKALDELCERKATGTSCSYTIGPAGDFKTLLEAIEKLQKKKENDVSLCFMPGDHAIDEDILMIEKKMKFTSLKISGYTSRIAMKAKRMELAADKLMLQGFILFVVRDNKITEGGNLVEGNTTINKLKTDTFKFDTLRLDSVKIDSQTITAEKATAPKSAKRAARPVAENQSINIERTDNTQIILAAAEINMDYCTWFKADFSNVPFISIINEGIVYLNNNKILAWFSLSLADGIGGIIEGNLISYLLLQNRSINPFQPMPFSWSTADFKNIIRNKMIETNVPKPWALTIRGNNFGFLITNVDQQKPHNLYQNLFITDNIFQFAGNSFLATFLHVANNQFLFEDNPPKAVVQAYILGHNVIVMGNSGTSTRVTGGPAPLLGVIDAIVFANIRGAGINNAQVLNLVNVTP